MLDSRFNVPPIGHDKEWTLSLPYDADWRTSKNRVLIILQSVDGRDLKDGGLLSNRDVRIAFTSAVNYAKAHARRYTKLPNFSFAVANFQSYKHLHLRGHARSEAEADFRVRMAKIIKKMNPTHILFSGDVSVMYPIKQAPYKNGWVHNIDGRKVTSTVDFARLLEKNGALANLLGFWCRHLANLLIGRLPHDLSHVKAKPIYVDTIKKFDKVMALFDTAKFAALDTETRNLSVLHNAIYTIQFAFDHDPLKGYVIPVDHPHQTNPFNKEERLYIKKALRKRFRKEEGPTLITLNGMFDIRIVRAALDLDIVYLRVWEITAGEHDLDENISSLASLGIKSGGLAAIYCAYGNDHYYKETTAFSKDQRGQTGQTPVNDPGFLEYAATDVVSIIHIRPEQIARADRHEFLGKTYKPYFMRHMMYQMSDTVHHLSQLMATGSLIDRKYLRSLRGSDSVLAVAIKELNEEFRTFPEVQKANEILLEESGFKTGSLFGGTKKQWVFSFNKSAHKTKLFFEVMGLTPVSQTQTGADAVDKEFIEHYKDRNFLVEKFGEYQAATKLLSTYVKGWYKKLTTEIDGATDNFLRAAYKFFNVDTGRLASADPNLQNIPARGKLSKIIKEMFVTMDGHLLIRFDYSAHEVRGWSIVSNDKVLAGLFLVGQKLRQQWIKNPTPELAAEIKKKGDLHINSVFRFFGKWVEKSDPLREAVKAVVFGVLYGKSAATLGHDTKKADLGALKAQMNEAYRKNDPILKKLVKQFLALIAEDRTDQAQKIIDKMNTEFKRGHQWVLKMQDMATNQFYVYSPIGRIRHLYAAMTKDRQIVSRQVRRGMNAPIQGFASEIAVKAGRLTTTTYYRSLPRIKEILNIKGRMRFFANRIVHDASYYTVPFEMVIPFLHILQWCTTYGIAREYKEQFGLEFTVEPEIEIEIGVKDTASRKWDWSLPELAKIIESAVDDGIAAKILTESKADIMKKIYAPWRNEDALKLLDSEFPLLNVSLRKEIKHLLAEISKPKVKEAA